MISNEEEEEEAEVRDGERKTVVWSLDRRRSKDCGAWNQITAFQICMS
jgi:hypothetical protein